MGRRWRTVLAGLLALPALAAPAAADEVGLAIGRLNYAGFSDKQHCTGTLVAPRVALTAWHCLVLEDVPGMHLLLGYERENWNEHLRPVAAVEAKSPGDLALLCLDKASEAQPIAVAPQPAVPGEKVLVIGYGMPFEHVASRTSCQVLEVDQQGAFRLDCPLAPGTSGAPVLRDNSHGYEIVGVVSATNSMSSIGYRFTSLADIAACQGG